MKESEEKLVVVLVGLPARGKTYIASKLCRYLKWKGHHTRIFNTGMYRQTIRADWAKNCDFFDPANEETAKIRQQVIDQTLDDLIGWIKSEGRVGIYDASNTQRARRELVLQRCQEIGAQVFFIESFCEDERIIRANVAEFKDSSPDYQGVSTDVALEDFARRIEFYRKTYEPLDLELDHHVSFLKMVDVGRQMVCNLVQGHMQTSIVHFLMNVHIVPRTIYLSRHGESEFNVQGRIGGDTGLSARGLQYAQALAACMDELNPPKLQVWTSTMLRTIETAQFLKGTETPNREWRCLEEINAGICDGLTYKEIADRFPLEFAQRDVDKYNYRYPRGESYHDIVVRLEPVMMELERAHNVLVIAHQAVLRCLLAYFLDLPAKELPYIKVPLHTLLKLSPIAYGCRVEQVPLNVAAVDTHRPASKKRGLSPSIERPITNSIEEPQPTSTEG